MRDILAIVFITVAFLYVVYFVTAVVWCSLCSNWELGDYRCSVHRWLDESSRQHNPMPGDSVVLKKLPLSLLANLPKEDQTAICAIVGKRVRLNEYGNDGKAELQFTDSNGGIHFIYVLPDFIIKTERNL